MVKSKAIMLVIVGLILIVGGIAAIAYKVTDVTVMCGEVEHTPGKRCADAEDARISGVGITYEKAREKQLKNKESIYTVGGVIAILVGVATTATGGFGVKRASSVSAQGSQFPAWSTNRVSGASPTETPSPPAAPGRDALVRLELSLAECAIGTTKTVLVDTAERCGQCAGTGTLGRSAGVCARCGGEGRVRVRRNIDVAIPAGVASGHRVRVPGQGEAGLRGGAAADLYVEIVEQTHPGFTREGNNLHTSFLLAAAAAERGCSITVSTLIDGPTQLRIAARTQPGAVITLRGYGMPQINSTIRGDLHVHIHLR